MNSHGMDQKKSLENKDQEKKDVADGKKEKTAKISEDNRMRNMLTGKMKEMETEFDLVEHVVIDMGNAITKIGFSGEDLPKFIIPSIYGRHVLADSEKKNEILTYEQKLMLFGYEPLEKKNKENYNVRILSPGDHKKSTDPEFYDLFKEVFETKLQITPSDYKVIVNISPIKNQDNIHILGKMFLEDLGFKALALINSSSLSLFATGGTSGLVIECGETRTYSVPIYEGFPLYHALNKNKIGGRDLTSIINKGIQEADLGVSDDDLFNLRCIKEKMCSVPYLKEMEYYLNSNDDIITEEKMLYKLPDERIINIPKECRLKASEVLFRPSIINRNERGLVTLITESIKKTVLENEEFKKIILGNIVLSGGTTMIPGFKQRIEKDLIAYHDQDLNFPMNPDVKAESNRDILTWLGESMIASMSSFDKMFIKKEEYQDSGEEAFAKIF